MDSVTFNCQGAEGGSVFWVSSGDSCCAVLLFCQHLVQRQLEPPTDHTGAPRISSPHATAQTAWPVLLITAPPFYRVFFQRGHRILYIFLVALFQCRRKGSRYSPHTSEPRFSEVLKQGREVRQEFQTSIQWDGKTTGSSLHVDGGVLPNGVLVLETAVCESGQEKTF